MTLNVTTLNVMTWNEMLFEDMLSVLTSNLPHPPSDPRAHETVRDFCSGSHGSEKTPTHISPDSLAPQPVYRSAEENRTGRVCVFSSRTIIVSE